MYVMSEVTNLVIMNNHPWQAREYFWNLGRSHKNTLRDSAQDGLGQGAAVSPITACNLRWKRISTQSMMRMIRCGGRPSFLTVAVNRYQNSEFKYILSVTNTFKLHISYNMEV
jgi:hypothetical protein